MKLCALLIVASAVASAHSYLVNPSFELPAIPDGNTAAGANGWSGNVTQWGVWNIFPGYAYFSSEAPDGTQILYSNSGTVAQQSSLALQEGIVKLSAMGGRRQDVFAGSFQMQLWAGGSVSNGAVTGGFLLASADFDHTKLSPSTFAPLHLNFAADSSNPYLGQLLSVRFVTLSGQMNVDNVRLEFEAVPEPATMAAVGLGALAVLRRRRAR